ALRREGRRRPAALAHRAAVPLQGQGQPRDHRPRRRRCRASRRREAERLPRLGDVALRPPLLSHRLPEPRARVHPLDGELRDTPERRTTDHSTHVSIWDRIRSFWAKAPEPDHALTESERDAQHPDSAYYGLARAADDFVGDDFDPDDR